MILRELTYRATQYAQIHQTRKPAAEQALRSGCFSAYAQSRRPSRGHMPAQSGGLWWPIPMQQDHIFPQYRSGSHFMSIHQGMPMRSVHRFPHRETLCVAIYMYIRLVYYMWLVNWLACAVSHSISRRTRWSRASQKGHAWTCRWIATTDRRTGL